MHPILTRLEGGDRRSIGRADEVADMVMKDPALLAVLFEGMQSGDPLLRMRCADAAEKVTARHPDWLEPYRALLLGPLATATQQEVRWHACPMIARLRLTEDEASRAAVILEGFLADRSIIVRTMALQAVADLAVQHPKLLPHVQAHVSELFETGPPAVRARCRKLLTQLGKVTPGQA